MQYFHPLPSGLRMHYEIRGKTDSKHPPLVFLNGLSQSTLAWRPLIQSGIEEEFSSICVDLVFQGKSDSGETYRNFEQHADDLRDLLENLGHKTYTIIGISYGGAVAQRLMVKYPEICHKVFLLSTFATKGPFFEAIGDSWKKALLCGDYELMFEVMLPFVLGKSYFEKPLVPLEELKNAKKEMSPKTSDLLKLMEATEKSSEFIGALSTSKVETIVVQGEEDILCTPEMGKKIADALQNSSFILLPKVGHTLNLEAINPLQKIILHFCGGGNLNNFPKESLEV